MSKTYSCTNICVDTSFYLFCISIYIQVELLDHMVTLYLTLWGAKRLNSKVAAPFYVPVNNVWGFQFLSILTKTSYFHFYYRHPSGCKVVSHYGFYFICIFLIISVVSHVFMCVLDELIDLFLIECISESNIWNCVYI